MRLEVNGVAIEVPSGRSIVEVLAAAGLDDLRGMAVAVDGEVIPRSAWASALPAEGQRLEIVRAVQGGAPGPVGTPGAAKLEIAGRVFG
ncbi:MAG: sulfur carrier protein ThiS, partial [Actinomycetota bacterium]